MSKLLEFWHFLNPATNNRKKGKKNLLNFAPKDNCQVKNCDGLQISIYVYSYIYIYIHKHIHIYMCLCFSGFCLSVYVYVCMCAFQLVQIYLSIYLSISVYSLLSIYLFINRFDRTVRFSLPPLSLCFYLFSSINIPENICTLSLPTSLS